MRTVSTIFVSEETRRDDEGVAMGASSPVASLNRAVMGWSMRTGQLAGTLTGSSDRVTSVTWGLKTCRIKREPDDEGDRDDS